MQITDKSSVRLLREEFDYLFGTSSDVSILGCYSFVALLRYIKLLKGDYQTDKESEEKIQAIDSGRRKTTEVSEEVVYDEPEFLNALNNPYSDFKIIDGASGFTLTGSEALPQGWRQIEKPPFPAADIKSAFTLVYTKDGKQEKESATVFINEEQKKVAIFVKGYIGYRLMRRIQSCLWLIMPWYYPTIPGKDELEFFKIFDKDGSTEDVVAEFNRLAETFDAKSFYFKNKLLSYASGFLAKRGRQLQSEITRSYDYINDYTRRISDEAAKVTSLEAELKLFFETPKNSSELYEFFSSRKNINLISITEDSIFFEIVDFLEFWDDDECKRIFDRESSYIYDALGSESPDVIKALFVERQAQVKVAARFQLSGLKTVVVRRGELDEHDVLPHPHLYQYGCLGGNAQYLSDFAKRGEWQLQIDQCIGATKNINWGDSTVCSWMIRWFKTHKATKCIYKDGVAMSYTEFKKTLKQKDEKGE